MNMKKGLLDTYTVKLIIVNVFLFILSLIFLNIYGEGFLNFIALNPENIFSGRYLWTIFTSIFMHGGVGHLLANMVSLFFIGMFVEQLIGKKRFLAFYLIAGLFASVFYATLAYFLGGSFIGARLFGTPGGFALGASGAIFGLLGLLAVLTPNNRVYLIAGPLIAVILQSVLAVIIPGQELLSILDLAIMIYFVFSIFAIISFDKRLRKWAVPVELPFWVLPIVAIVPLVIIGLFVQLPIGNSAHLGGLLVGLAYGYYLKRKYPRKTARINRMFSR